MTEAAAVCVRWQLATFHLSARRSRRLCAVKLRGGAQHLWKRRGVAWRGGAAGEPDPGSIACKRAAITLFNCLGLGSSSSSSHVGKPHVVRSFAGGADKKLHICMCEERKVLWWRDAKSGRAFYGQLANVKSLSALPRATCRSYAARSVVGEKVSAGQRVTLWGLGADRERRQITQKSVISRDLYFKISTTAWVRCAFQCLRNHAAFYAQFGCVGKYPISRPASSSPELSAHSTENSIHAQTQNVPYVISWKFHMSFFIWKNISGNFWWKLI